MRVVAVLAVVACRHDAPPQPPPPEPAVAPPAAVARLPKSANDDLPHRTAELAPLFASAVVCISPSDELTLDLEVFDGQLVTCAQARTRRDVSVFFDDVSYACWTVAPATGVLARRRDLGRAFFECRDGKCEPEALEIASFDGHALLVYDDTQHPIEVYERRADGSRGARARAFDAPAELAKADPLHGELVYAPPVIFAPDRAANTTVVLDDHGRVLGTAKGTRIDVLDETHALIRVIERQDAPDPHHVVDHASLRATSWTAGRGAPITLDHDYTAGPVLLGSAAYALVGRTLYELDAKSLRAKKSYPLATCK